LYKRKVPDGVQILNSQEFDLIGIIPKNYPVYAFKSMGIFLFSYLESSLYGFMYSNEIRLSN